VAGVLHACLWGGTAASCVDLHPPGAEFSYASAIHGTQQVGTAKVGGSLRATLWFGTAGAVDLQPSGAHGSQAYAVHDGQQAGYAISSGSPPHASVWTNTAASWVDLHRYLPKRFGGDSYAMGIWHDANYVYVVGWARDTSAQRDEALMWRRRR
jgi:hypothetical protein